MSQAARRVVEAEDFSGLQIAVLIPCFNEEHAIGTVVRDFRAALPTATVYVYDNNSSDNTRAVALEAGAVVRSEPLQGKGNVVRRMFADIDADVYVMVDGDATYDAASAPQLVARLLDDHLDMVNAARVASAAAAYRSGHRFGNRLLSGIVQRIFGDRIVDLLSGYRVFSRRFVKSFPALASGFEIETELTVHAMELRMPIAEVSTPYKERPEGSYSKLRTIPDGIRILRTILLLAKEERPLQFFSAVGGVFAVAAVLLAAPLLPEYLRTGLVPRFPTAILSTGLMIIAALSVTCGVIVDSVTRSRREIRRMFYLRQPGPFQR